MLRANNYQNAIAYQHPKYADKMQKECMRGRIEFCSRFLTVGEWHKCYPEPKNMDRALEKLILKEVLALTPKLMNK